MFDVVVVGAGLAGLVCARSLAQAEYSVVVVEKSRGLGGRIATRRLDGTCVDHGVRYLESKGHLLQRLIQVLSERNLIQVWTDIYDQRQQLEPASIAPCYVAPDGMSAIAKFLATGLEIRFNQRVKTLASTISNNWHLTLEPTNSVVEMSLIAKSIVVAIPAPQALMLLEPLAESGLPAVFLDSLRSVEFDPCLSVIAGYAALEFQPPVWKAINFIDDPDLAWIGLDSSKRIVAGQPLFVLQSSAEFAHHYLEAQNLQPAGQQLLTRAAQKCSLPWLDTPDLMQVHRWRYAFPHRPWHEAYLSAPLPLPLVCCGDWCGGESQISAPSGELSGNYLESAMLSGLAAAEQINLQLEQRSLLNNNLDFLE